MVNSTQWTFVVMCWVIVGLAVALDVIYTPGENSELLAVIGGVLTVLILFGISSNASVEEDLGEE